MQYNAKIKEAETGPAKGKSTNRRIFSSHTLNHDVITLARMKLDSAAASRFIIAAIPKSQRIPPPGSSTQTPIPPSAQAGPGPSSAAYVPPVGKMTRFRTFEGGEVDMSGGGEEAGEEDGEGNVGFEAGEDEDEDEDMEVETAPVCHISDVHCVSELICGVLLQTKPVNKHLKFALSDDESSRSKSRSPSPSATTSTLPTSPSKLKRTSSAVIEPEVSGSGAGKGNKKRKVDKGEIGGKGKGGKAKGKEGAGKGVKGKKGKEKKKAF